MNVFLTRLKILSKMRHLKQSDLARIADISQPTISLWYKRDQWPSADVVRKLALGLEVSADYLLGTSDEMGGKIALENQMLLEAVKGFTAAEIVDVISYTGLVKTRRKTAEIVLEGESND